MDNTKISLLTATISVLTLMAAAFPVKALDVAIPVYVNIVKNQPGTGLAIRADKYSYQAVYRNNAFNDISMNFDVVQLNNAIFKYKMTILALDNMCDSETLTVKTTLDNFVIVKNDQLIDFTFNQSDDIGDFRNHQVLFTFPEITKKSYEQSCNGILAISIAEQL